LPVGIDGALRLLLVGRGLLEVQPDLVILSAAENAVAAGLLRMSMTGQPVTPSS
jgi:hypothetical protein